MTIIGKFLRKIAKFFRGLSSELKDSITIAVTIVDIIKIIVENPISGNILEILLVAVKKAIPGTLDDVLIDKLWKALKELLPKLLLDLTILNAISTIEDPELKAEKLNEQLQLAIAKIRFSTEEQKQVFWRGFSCKFAEVISDGKITWSELGGLTEYVYVNKNA